MFDNNGEIGDPCGLPLPSSLFRVVRWRSPLLVGLFHRCLQPHLDQPQDAAVADPPGHRFHQLGMRDAVEVTGQVRVDHLGMPRPEQPFDLPNGVQGAALRAVGVLFRLQVGLEDRLQDQHRRHLHHAIFDARNAHSTLPPHPNRLRDSSPSPIRIIRSAASGSRSSGFAEGLDPDLIVRLPDGRHAAIAMSGTDYALPARGRSPPRPDHLLDLDGLRQVLQLLDRISREGRR